MLNPYNEYLYYYIVKETTAKYRREAEVDHQLNQLNLRRSNRLAQQLRRALLDLGHAFVELGRRLDTRSV